jgi:hypothetical protein
MKLMLTMDPEADDSEFNEWNVVFIADAEAEVANEKPQWESGGVRG